MAWEEAEAERIKTLSNKDLFHESFDLAGGDDYDGCFTSKGRQSFDMLKAELELRLADWLNHTKEEE